MEDLAVAATREPAHAELEELIRRVQAYNPQADVQLICRAYEYSARMHAEQKRESGEPYVTHPLAVALIIAQLKLDLPSIITGLLHDVVEDTMASLDEVRELFGDLFHVDELTYHCNKLTNRKTGVEIHKVIVNGTFSKK